MSSGNAPYPNPITPPSMNGSNSDQHPESDYSSVERPRGEVPDDAFERKASTGSIKKEPNHDNSCMGSVKRGFGTAATYTSLSVSYTIADIKSRPRNFCIGMSSIFIVVFFVGLILGATSKTPLVLVRFAELQVGEMDALVLAEGSVPFANYTEMEPRIARSKEVSGSAPRWLLKGEVQNIKQAQENQRRERDGLEPLEIPTLATNIAILDTLKEKEVGIGRAWPYREIGYAEAQIYHSALRFINLRPNVGDRARMFIDVASILEQQGVSLPLDTLTGATGNLSAGLDGLDPNAVLATNVTVGGVNITNFTTQDLFDIAEGVTVAGGGNTTATTLLDLINGTIAAPEAELGALITPEVRLTVADSITEIEGKYPAALGNMVVMDYRTLKEMLLEQNCLSTTTGQNALLETAGLGTTLGGVDLANPVAGVLEPIVEPLKLEEYALVVVAMFKRRLEIYYSEDRERTRDMIRVSNDLFLAVGINYGGSVQYPLAVALSGFYFLQLFLDSIFLSVVAVIVILGALLVYTLLLTNSEERAFEVAMIRAQGMAKSQLFHLMVTQALAFIVPGCVLALALVFIVNMIIEVVLEDFTKAPAQLGRFPGWVIGFAIAMGFGVPLLSNWGPIKSAMSHSLRDALDVYRQANNEVKVTMLKLSELGLEPWQIMMGWFLTIAGFLIYYMIPYAFIFDELWLFFLILNAILLTMLFGLCMVAYSLQEPLERLTLWLLLWGPDRRLHTLIIRNLGAHRERNSKSFMMFACSVAAIIFGGVLFTLLSVSLSQTLEIFNGSTISLTSLDSDFPLNKTNIDEFLKSRPQTVESWTFLTYPLRDYPQMDGSEVVSNVLGFPKRSTRFVGVDRNFLRTVFPEYVSFADIDKSFSYPKTQDGIDDVVASMYDSPPIDQLQEVGTIFTGWPRNLTVPDVDAKYRFIVPCIMASGATELMGINSDSYATVEVEYITGTGSLTRARESEFLLRPRAMADRMSGFPLISKLRFAFRGSSVLIPIPDFQRMMAPSLIDFAGEKDPRYRMAQDTIFEPTYQKLFVRLRDGVSDEERTDFVNFLQSRVNPYYHQPLDSVEIKESIQLMSDLIIYFFFFISAVAIILDTFMLWLAFVSNVKLNSWAFGVLRSLGFTVNQLIRGYVYEAMSIVLSSFFVGTIIGILVALTLMLQMNLFLQLPFRFDFPWELFLFVFLMSLVSALLGSTIPSMSIARRSISGVLKGN